MSTTDFLLEVRCEEIPARMLGPGTRQLATRLFEELMARGLGPRELETGFTPRRLVVTLRGVPDKEKDRREEMVGPPVSVAYDDQGNPTKALQGFARKCGLEPDELEEIETPKGRYLRAELEVLGRPTSEILAELVPKLLSQIPWPKAMRWGDRVGPWVRPVHGIVALLGTQVVPFELFGVVSGCTTVGHPISSPQTLEIREIDEYRQQMESLGIEVSFEARRDRLQQGLTERATARGGQLVDDPELLDRVSSMCEVPGLADGSFDEAFLDLPREVLVTSLRDHQSAFTVEKDGGLLAGFLTVMDRADDPQGRVQAGNEWVVAARLADARFFYDEDRKRSLGDRLPDLQGVVLHERLGTYAEKTERIVEITGILCDQLGWADERPDAVAAAALLKVDLATEMVKEFTSLQGVMGGVYARDEGLAEAVWQAIYDQYLPSSTDDPIPRGRVGQVVALADRIDTLAGMFGRGLIPTGSRDPFGLRRAAQAAVRIVLEADLSIDLDVIFRSAIGLYGDRVTGSEQEILGALRPFVYDRVRHLLGREGCSHDEIEAALAVGTSNLPDLRARAMALHEARDEPGFREVVLAAKRIANIIRDSPAYVVDPDLFKESAEHDLAEAAEGLAAVVEEAETDRNYLECFRCIAKFADVLDRFFVEVLVMDEDSKLRENRLALLQTIHTVLSRTSGLTEMVMERADTTAKA